MVILQTRIGICYH